MIKGPPVTQEQMAKILKLSKKDVDRLNALAASTPGLYDSSESIIQRHKDKAVSRVKKLGVAASRA